SGNWTVSTVPLRSATASNRVHCCRHGVANLRSGHEPGDRAIDVGRRTVLAELELCLDPADEDLNPNDRPELSLDVWAGRIIDRPRHGSRSLVSSGQGADVGLDPCWIVVDHELAMDMGRDVVPGRYDATVLALRRVPGRRNVGVGPTDDGHRLADGRHLPLAVVAGDVTHQPAVGATRPRRPCGRGRGHA